MRQSRWMLIVFACFILISCGENSFEAKGLGTLESVVAIGEIELWTGSREGGVYRLENQSDPDAIRYFYNGFEEGEGGQRRAVVDVTIDAGAPEARAGLLYGFRQSPRSYFMIVTSPDETLEVYRRDDNGLELTMSSSFRPSKSGFERLEIAEEGSELRIRVNGKGVGAFQSRGTGGGSIGIVAMGRARFGFTNFEQDPPHAGLPGEAAYEQEVTESAEEKFPEARLHDARATAGETLRLKRFEIVDQQGFKEPVVVMSFLGPADWELEGNVKWNFSWRCITDLVNVHARIVSPDNKYSFEISPTFAAKWYDDAMANQLVGSDGCQLAAPFQASDFVSRYYTPRFRPGAEIVGTQGEPSVAEAAREKLLARRRARIEALNAHIQTDAGRTRLRYTDELGESEEWVLATVTVVTMPGPLYSTSTDPTLSFRAPLGQLDENEKLFSTIVGSFRINPLYVDAVMRVVDRVGQIEQQGFEARMDIIQRQNQRLFQDWEASLQQRAIDWKVRMDQQDRTHQRWNEAIRGTATFKDARHPEASWELTNDYEYAWRSSTDELIMTNDANVNPNEMLNSNEWELMRRQR